MKKIILAAAIAAACIQPLGAQTVYDLTLEESIEIAKKQSYSMQTLEQDVIIAENNLKSATAQLRTSVTANLVLPQYTETVREWEDSTGISFFPIKTLRGSGNLNITQPLPTDGRIYLSGGLSSIDDYYTDQRAATVNARIGFSQPLDAFYGYNNISSSLKRARLDYERSSKSLKREELNLIYSVSSAYYNLLSLQKGMEIAAMNLDKQTEAYDISKKKYEAELIREVETLQMEVDLAEAQNSYDMSILGLNAAKNSFKQLLGLELDAEINLKSELNYEIVAVDPEKAVQLALKNRLEIREREINIELQRLTLKQQKAQGLPKASLEAYYERIGVNRQNVDYSYSSSFNNSWYDLRQRPSNFGVGLNLSIPIIDWGRNRAQVRSAEARLMQTEMSKTNEERQIETEVRNLVANVQSALARLQLLEKNLVVAQRSFDITLQRFSEGDIDTQNLALDRTRYNQAQKSHLEAYISYQLALADLMRKTFYDFKTNQPVGGAEAL